MRSLNRLGRVVGVVVGLAATSCSSDASGPELPIGPPVVVTVSPASNVIAAPPDGPIVISFDRALDRKCARVEGDREVGVGGGDLDNLRLDDSIAFEDGNLEEVEGTCRNRVRPERLRIGRSSCAWIESPNSEPSLETEYLRILRINRGPGLPSQAVLADLERARLYFF